MEHEIFALDCTNVSTVFMKEIKGLCLIHKSAEEPDSHSGRYFIFSNSHILLKISVLLSNFFLLTFYKEK